MERYFCIVPKCKRSLRNEGKYFSREDNCRKHMAKVHGLGEEEVKVCGMDEETKRVRLERRAGKRG
jgi:hypothetical protein